MTAAGNAAAEEFARAAQAYQRGDPESADSTCRRILSLQPRHLGASYLLGLIELQRGRPADAVVLISRFVEANTGQADAHVNLGAALLALGRSEEAVASFDRALKLNAKFGLAWTNRGNALLSLKQPEAALKSYQHALDDDPRDARAHCNLGNALLELGRHEEALASYERAYAIKPDYALALRNRATLLRDLDRPAQALACFEQIVQMSPQDKEALTTCGNLLLGLSRPAEAVAYFDRALELDPALLEALNNRGIALMAQDDSAAALRSFDRALELSASTAEFWGNRGEALRRLNRFAEAADSYAKLLEIAPQSELARGKRLYAKLLACDWTDYEALRADLAGRVAGGERACAPFEFLAISGEPGSQLACAHRYCDGLRLPPVSPPSTLARGRREKIRLAYVSGDFGNRPMAHLLVGVLEQHDRDRFETIGISLRPEDPSEIGQRIMRSVDRFIDVSALRDREIVDFMRELDVDIAIDLMGHTHGSRPGIFEARAAPLQLSYLGFPGTSGMESIDYLIADDFVVPESSWPNYAEKIISLPDCFQANDDRRAIGALPTRAQMGLPETGFVFCCFNHSYKINPPLFDSWCRLLAARPQSVLWLAADTPEVQSNLRREAERRGIDPNRVIIAGRVPYAEHLGRQRLADLFLDTLPFNAGTTASDALWAGLPVLTCSGASFASRMVGSLLKSVGLPELMTESLAEYEGRALELSGPESRLASLRARLSIERHSRPLFDTRRFCRQLEPAYCRILEWQQQGHVPASFAVGRVPRT